MKSFKTDVVIVGCGVAGLSAALSAQEAGAKTINIERSTYDERGGNSRWTDANLLIKPGQQDFELMDSFWEGFAYNNGYNLEPDFTHQMASSYEQWHPNIKTAPMVDAEVLGAFAENIPDTLDWLESYGVTVNKEGVPFAVFIDLLPFAQINGGGLALIEALTPVIEEKGGEFLYETTATELVTDNSGKVTGLKCSGKNNETIVVHAKSVILASGGFQGNPQMLAQYMGPNSRWVKPVAKGGYYNKGEGLKMALELNAAPAGDWADAHLQMTDPRSTQPEALVNIWQCGILVNQNGERFIDECPDNWTEWQEEPGRAVIQQKQGISYIILDDALYSGEDQTWRKGLRTEVEPYRANSLEGLATQLNISSASLLNTVEKYNQACVQSDEVNFGEWDPVTLTFGGKATQGVEPPKSNYAKRIEKAPFYCYPMIASICFTCGGLKVTPNAQVLNYSAEVIPGLYAAGETVGLYYGVYVGATSVLRGLTFGRIAGTHAASLK